MRDQARQDHFRTVVGVVGRATVVRVVVRVVVRIVVRNALHCLYEVLPAWRDTRPAGPGSASRDAV